LSDTQLCPTVLVAQQGTLTELTKSMELSPS
jgi:hypothetical protein